MSLSKRILVIEDNQDLRRLYNRSLSKAGFDVAEATNGQEALDALEAFSAPIERPRLIVLDLMMPVMDGWEFLVEFNKRADLNQIPIVVVSASAERMPTGVRVLSKPIDVTEIVKLAKEQDAFAGP